MGKQRNKKGVDPNELQKFLDSYSKDKPKTKAKKQADPYFDTGNLGFGQIQPSQEATPWPTNEVAAPAPQEQPEDTITDPLDDIVSSVEDAPEPMDDLLQSVEENMGTGLPTVEEQQRAPIDLTDPQKKAALEQGQRQEKIQQDINNLLEAGKISEEEALELFDKRMKGLDVAPEPETKSKLDQSMDMLGAIEQDETARATVDRLMTPKQIERAAQRKANNLIFKDIAQKALDNLPEPEKKDKWDLKIGEYRDYEELQQTDKQTRQMLQSIINMSEDEGNFQNFMKGVGDQGPKMIPFLGALVEMDHYAHQQMIQSKPEEERSASEKKYIEAVALMNTFKQEGLSTDWYEYGELTAMMVPYALEFGATSGIYSGTARATQAGLKAIGMSGKAAGAIGKANRAANFVLRNTAGAVAQATAAPHRYMAETKRRMTDTMLAIVDADAKEIDSIVRGKKGESFEEAFAKAYGTNLSEFFTERFGMIGLKAATKIKGNKFFKQLADKEAFQKYTLGLFAKKRGLNYEQTKKVAEKLAWHGVITEVWGEEYPNMIINAAITGDQAISEAADPFGEDINKMWIPAMIFQGMMYAPQTLQKGGQKITSLIKESKKPVEGAEATEKKTTEEPPVEPPPPPTEVVELEDKPDDPEPPTGGAGVVIEETEEPETPEPIEIEPEGEPEIKISKENKIAVDLFDQLSKLAEDGNTAAANLADMYDLEFDKEVTGEWIEDAENLIKKVEEDKAIDTGKFKAIQDKIIKGEELNAKELEEKKQFEEAGRTFMTAEEAKEAEREAERSRIKTVDVPITRIQHDLKRFQNRRAAYSEQSVKNIMDAVEAGTFDLNKFDPIRIWKDPKNNRTYVLAGHSRLEAFNRLSDEKEGFDNIPTIDMSHLTEEEAIKYAKEESNTMATAESVLDVASSWRKDREEGISNAEIQRKNKNRPNVARSELLSWVNPKGKAWAALEAMEGKGSESARVLQIGEFLGHARRQFKQLTDTHENELYDWLADAEDGKKIVKRPDFINRVENVVARFDFDPEKPLNIAKRTTMGSLEAEARQKDKALKTQLKQAEEERSKATTQERMDELTREIKRLQQEIIDQNRKIQEAKSADRMQGDLFAQPDVEETPTEEAKFKPGDLVKSGEWNYEAIVTRIEGDMLYGRYPSDPAGKLELPLGKPGDFNLIAKEGEYEEDERTKFGPKGSYEIDKRKVKGERLKKLLEEHKKEGFIYKRETDNYIYVSNFEDAEAPVPAEPEEKPTVPIEDARQAERDFVVPERENLKVDYGYAMAKTDLQRIMGKENLFEVSELWNVHTEGYYSAEGDYYGQTPETDIRKDLARKYGLKEEKSAEDELVDILDEFEKAGQEKTIDESKEIDNKYPIKESTENAAYRVKHGYNLIKTVKAPIIKQQIEDFQGDPIDWNPERLKAAKERETTDAYPLVTITDNGDLSLTDGGHRIAAAAEANQHIDVAFKGDINKYLTRVKENQDKAVEKGASGKMFFPVSDDEIILDDVPTTYRKEIQKGIDRIGDSAYPDLVKLKTNLELILERGYPGGTVTDMMIRDMHSKIDNAFRKQHSEERIPLTDDVRAQIQEIHDEYVKLGEAGSWGARSMREYLEEGHHPTHEMGEKQIEFLRERLQEVKQKVNNDGKPLDPLTDEIMEAEFEALNGKSTKPAVTKQTFADAGILEYWNDYITLKNWKRANPEHWNKYPEGYVSSPQHSEYSAPRFHVLGRMARSKVQGYKQHNEVKFAIEKYAASQRIHYTKGLIKQISGEDIEVQTQLLPPPPKPGEEYIGKRIRLAEDYINPFTKGELIEEVLVPAGDYTIENAYVLGGTTWFDIGNDLAALPIGGKKKEVEVEFLEEKQEPTKSEQLKDKEAKLIDEFKDLLDEFGNTGNKLMSGVDPQQIVVAGKLIAKAGELGINQFQQLVAFIEEKVPGWLDDNYQALQGAYMAFKVSTGDITEDFNKIKSQSKDDAITEGANINRDAGRSTETASTTEEEGTTQEVPDGQGEQDGGTRAEPDEQGIDPEPSERDGDGGSPELSIDERIDRAGELGKQAFLDGISSSPVNDPALLELLEGLTIGEGADEIMKAWEDAWHKENLQPTGNLEEGEGIIQEARDGGNYVIPADYEAPKTFNVKRNLKANIDALSVLRDLKEEDRKATPEEQEILFKYVGWGGIKEISLRPESSWSWNASNVELKPYIQQAIDLMKDVYGKDHHDVLSAAQRSILNAHYTSIPVIRGIYSALEGFGMGGKLKVLEPSAGTGHFIGAMPQAMRKGSTSTAVELDRITGDILGYLYPNTGVKKTGLQKAGLPDGYYDLVISNIPFGDYKVSDPKYVQSPDTKRKKAQGKIHNYFFAKGLDLVRPGGVVAFITSSGVLDSPSNQFVRELMAREAEMVGAIKLPSSTFKGNAGTEVTTDLIFLRKYEAGEQVKQDQPFIKSSRKDGYNLNNYWDQNPGNMLGEIEKGGLYGEEGYKLVGPSEDLERRIPQLMANKMDYKPATSEASKKEAFVDAYEGENNERPGNLVVHKGKVGVFDAGTFVQLTDTKVTPETLKDFIEMRGALSGLIKAEVSGVADAELKPMREKLNQTYDDFVSKHGRVKTPKNWRWIRLDIDAYNLAALEVYDKEGKFEQKADIFDKRTIRQIDKIESVSDPRSAALISMNETGGINMDRIASLLQTGEEEAKELLRGVVYELPGGGYEIVDQYLSGNVKKKLREAEAAAELDERFNENVEALKDIIPDDIPIALIKTHMGARWIPMTYYERFLRDEYEMNPNWDFTLALVNDEFRMNTKFTSGTFDAIGTKAISGKQIFLHALNGKYPRITKEDPADKDKRIFDEAATAAARLKIDRVREEFSDYVTNHEEHGPELEAIYNEKFNAVVKGKVDGSYLTIPGYAGPSLRPHQKDAIAMLLQKGGGIIDHIVGAGKTLVMIAGAMEMKRLGIAKKPVISAKKKTVANIASEAYAAFPAAKILVLDSENFNQKQRQATLAKIANNDWDLVIMSHENMGTIPPAPSAVTNVLTEMIEKLELDIEFLQGTEESWGKREAKALEKRKANLEAKIEEVSAKNADATVRTFDQTGIDHIFVDESHTFKNLQYTTRHGNVAGLGPAKGSDRANNLMFNIRHLQTILKGDRGATFLSGTMITNSIVEMYSILNYLRPNMLRELGIENFDAWASTFSEATSDLELGVTGEVKQKARFRKFSNVPELAMMYAEIADVRNDDNMKLPKPDLDGPQLVLISPSKAFQKFTKRLIAFAKTGAYEILGLGPGTEGQSKAKMLVAANLAQKAAIDMRLIFAEAPEERESKVVVAAEKIFGAYKESEEYKGTQLVFLDAQNAGEGLTFNTHKALKEKLMDYGIPKDEIVSISGLSDEKTQQVFQKVRDGEVRIMIGHKGTMGTGVNVQDRVIAMHHLDIGWNPSNHTQADGRGARQGNWAAEKYLDNKIPSFYYGMENSLDAFKFQHLQTKAQFIAQMTQGNVAERETSEESGDDIEMGTFLASLTGNNALMEEGKVAAKIKKLTLEKRAFTQNKHNNQHKLREEKIKIEAANKQLPKIKQDAEYLQENGQFEDDGTIVTKATIGKTEFTKPKELGEAIWDRLGELYMEIRDGERVNIGKIHNFDIAIESKKDGKGTRRLHWFVIGPSGIKYTWNNANGFVAGDVRSDRKLVDLGRVPVESLNKIADLEKKYSEIVEKGDQKVSQLEEALKEEWTKDDEIFQLKAEQERLKEEIAQYDLDQELGDDTGGSLWDDEEGIFGEPLAARGSKSRGERGKSGASISTYPQRMVTPEEIKKLEEDTKVPWRIHQKLLELTTKWAPDAKVGQGGASRGAIGTYYPRGKHIRVEGMNDFDVYIHELMHAVDYRFNVASDLIRRTEKGDEIRRRLTDIYEEFYPGAKRTHRLITRMREGLAVLVQQMAQNPGLVNAKYRDLVDTFFVEGGEYAFEGAEEFAGDIEQLIKEYQNLPPLEKMKAHIVGAIDTLKRKRDKIVNWRVSFVEELFDNKAIIEDLIKRAGLFMTDEDLAQFMRFIDNSAKWAKANISGDRPSYWAFNDAGTELIEKFKFNFKTIREKIKDRADVNMDDFGAWLYGRRIHGDYTERNALIEEQKQIEAEMLKIASKEYTSKLQEAKAMERLEFLQGQLDMVKEEIDRLNNILTNEGVSEIDAQKAYEMGVDLFDEEADMLDKLMWEDLMLLRKAKIVDQEFVSKASMKYGWYVPFKRVNFDEALKDPSEDQIAPDLKGQGRTKIASTMYRGGSTKPIQDPFISAEMNHADIMRKATRQMMYNRLIPLAKEMPEFFSPITYYPGIEKDPSVIVARGSAGNRVALKPHEKIKQAIDENFHIENVNLLAAITIPASKMFRTGTTGVYLPFIVANYAMDQISAFVNSKQPLKGLESLPFIGPLVTSAKPMFQDFTVRNINSLFNTALTVPESDEAKFYQEYRFLGGLSQTFLRSEDLEQNPYFQHKAIESLKSIKPAQRLHKAVSATTNFFAVPGLTSEVATRASEYIKARKAGHTQFIALEMAGRVSTPFHHMGRLKFGQKASMKQVVASIPYFNAGLQVPHQMYRTWMESKEGRMKIMGVMTTIAAVNAYFLFSLLDDDDREEQLATIKAQDPEILARYMFIPTDSGLIKIRMPENYAWMSAIVNMSILKMAGEADYQPRDFVSGITAAVPQQFNVLEPWEMLYSIAPPLAKAPLEVGFNKKSYPRVKELVPFYLEGEREDPYASPVANAMSGDKWFQLDMHPKKIDHLITGLFGRASKTVMDIPDMGKKDFWIRVLEKPFYQNLYMNSARQVVNALAIGEEVDRQFRDKVTRGNGTAEEKEKLQYVKSLFDGTVTDRSVVKKGKYRGNVRFSRNKRGENMGLRQMLKEYRDLDLKQEPVKAQKLRKRIFDRVKAIEKAWD